MADNEREIIVRVENTIVGGNAPQGTQNAQAQGVVAQPQSAQQNANNGFAAGISAQLLVGSLARIVSASGNTEAGRILSEGGAYGFLAMRLAASGGLDSTAWITLASKVTADILQALNAAKQEKIELAQQMNATDLIRMRSGQISINANTQISYNRYGRHSFSDRK
jgi:hypothetical protein